MILNWYNQNNAEKKIHSNEIYRYTHHKSCKSLYTDRQYLDKGLGLTV